jgi:hypothetical protein
MRVASLVVVVSGFVGAACAPDVDAGCDGADDCSDDAPFCVDAPGGACVECLVDTDCDGAEACDEITVEGTGTGRCVAG